MNQQRLHPTQIRELLRQAEVDLRAGELADSERACRLVLGAAPNNALAIHYLGAIAFSTQNYDAAIDLLRRSAELEPNIASFQTACGEALMRLGRHAASLDAYERAGKLKPDDARLQHRIGALAGQLGLVDRSIAALERSVKLEPSHAGALNDLGITLTATRRLDEAMTSFRKALEIDPNYRPAHDNIVYFMHFMSTVSGEQIKAEAEAWARRFAEPLTVVAPRKAPTLRTRPRLRIGYVSPQLIEHPVGRFMQSVLPRHDREQFEVFCYSDAQKRDGVSESLRSSVEHWNDTAALSDESLAAQIERDEIDLLIDLNLHMGHSRLQMFARKPAAVQATYLAYASTSGMSAMDWRVSDWHLDPPGNDRFYTERTVRLPRSYWCYPPPPCAAELPDQPAPRDPSAPITFACLNNIVKITDDALRAWARILRDVPDSRMIIQGEPGNHLDAMRAIFDAHGVDAATRIEFWPKRSLLDYFRLLMERIDIGLDPFPYAGGTSTCDALWSGVPIVTLAGGIAVHRGGVSILTNVGLPELITTSVDDYVAAGVALANDRDRLTSLRSTLRDRMKSSILMQPSEFVGNLEQIWRQIAGDPVISSP